MVAEAGIIVLIVACIIIFILLIYFIRCRGNTNEEDLSLNPSAPPLELTHTGAYNLQVANVPTQMEVDRRQSEGIYIPGPLGSSLLECRVCLEIPGPPVHIWQCSTGHPLCEDCKAKGFLSSCPVCRKAIVGRNHVFENIIKEAFNNVNQEEDNAKSVGDLQQREPKETFLCPACVGRFSSVELLVDHYEEHHNVVQTPVHQTY